MYNTFQYISYRCTVCDCFYMFYRLCAIDISCTLVLILQSLTTTKEGVETIGIDYRVIIDTLIHEAYILLAI